jgi:amidohydrolase
MAKIMMSAAFTLLLSGLAYGDEARDELFRATVNELFPKLVEIRRDFHANPELSNQEVRTAKVIAEKLRQLGLEVQEGVAVTGVIGLLKGKSEGRCVAVRADMDALPIRQISSKPYRSRNPGVMHACGHDVHITVALGVAELLTRHRDQLEGTVKFLFQPAEESMPATFKGDWGAKLMVAEGALENPRPEAVLALHSTTAFQPAAVSDDAQVHYLEAGQVGWNVGASSANSDRFQIKIKGKMAHGSAPHRGVDAIAVAAQVINALQLIRSRETNTQQPLVITVGMIKGGQRENIIAEEVTMAGTVRTADTALRDKVIALMERTVKGVTLAHGAEYELDYKKGYPVVMNDTALVNRLLPTMQRIVGEENAIEIKAGMGGEDFSFFSNIVPGFYYRLGCANEAEGVTGGAHTPAFDVDEQCLRTGVEVMAAMVCDFLES